MQRLGSIGVSMQRLGSMGVSMQRWGLMAAVFMQRGPLHEGRMPD